MMVDIELIRSETALTSVLNGKQHPSINLHLVTCEQPWWHKTPEDLAVYGINDPYWAFAWPGGLALAQFLINHPEYVSGKSILDVGAGSGVTSIAALMSGAASVTINDIDPWAIAVSKINLQANGYLFNDTPQIRLSCDDVLGKDVTNDVILLGDVTYAKELVAKIVPWIAKLTKSGKTILLADPGRGYLPKIGEVVDQVVVPSETDDGKTRLVSVDVIKIDD